MRDVPYIYKLVGCDRASLFKCPGMFSSSCFLVPSSEDSIDVKFLLPDLVGEAFPVLVYIPKEPYLVFKKHWVVLCLILPSM